jgi:Ni/Fe-hydrogenase subunit HybB-like protein
MNSTFPAKEPLNLSKILSSPINLMFLLLIAMGLVILVMRFVLGIGGVTALDNKNPWGLWISFDLLCGITLAAGGYMTSCAVCLLGLKQFRAALRPAIASAFLGYLFEVIALMADVGQPWRLHYPLLWSPAPNSVLFIVGLCVALYLLISCAQMVPQTLERINSPGLARLRDIARKLFVPLTVLGASVAVIHQAALGGLYLIAPSKLHPLWYSRFLPLFFLVSSMYAGLSMVILEGSLARLSAGVRSHMDQSHLSAHGAISRSFGRAAGLILLSYFLIRVFDLAMQDNWNYLNTDYGALYLAEMLGFTLLPGLMYLLGSSLNNTGIIRLASLLAVLGIILNRFCVSLLAFNWQLPAGERYFPSLMEIGFSISMLAMIICLYRLLAARTGMLRGSH